MPVTGPVRESTEGRTGLAIQVAAAAALLGVAPCAVAHGGPAADASPQWPLWLAQVAYIVAWVAYAGGALRRPAAWARTLAFHAAMVVAGGALFGPLDTLAATSTAWHMVQHMALIVVVAPLGVWARPWSQWRQAFGRGLDPAWRGLARLPRWPLACAMVHGLAIWAWHAPPLYLLAVRHTGWHVVEHAAFLFTAWLFWAAVLRTGTRSAPAAALALWFTLMHTGLLGALLTFAAVPLYGHGPQALWDQQLAGLVMWIPGGVVYLAAAGWMAGRWLRTPPPAVPPGQPTSWGSNTTLR